MPDHMYFESTKCYSNNRTDRDEVLADIQARGLVGRPDALDGAPARQPSRSQAHSLGCLMR